MREFEVYRSDLQSGERADLLEISVTLRITGRHETSGNMPSGHGLSWIKYSGFGSHLL